MATVVLKWRKMDIKVLNMTSGVSLCMFSQTQVPLSSVGISPRQVLQPNLLNCLIYKSISLCKKGWSGDSVMWENVGQICSQADRKADGLVSVHVGLQIVHCL